MSAIKSDKKYFLCKINDELFEVDNKNNRWPFLYDYLPLIIAEKIINSDEKDSYETSALDVHYKKEDNVITGNLRFLSRCLPPVLYNVNDKNSFETIITLADFKFKRDITKSPFSIDKNSAIDKILFTMEPIQNEIDAALFNSIIKDILNEEDEIELERFILVDNIEKLLNEIQEQNIKHHDEFRGLISDIFNNYLNILKSLRHHFNIEFFFAKTSFLDMLNIYDYDAIINDSYKINIFEGDLDVIFEEITDEKVIKKYLVKNNFK
ncbi:hypothetical protein CPT_Madawaska_133 [Staphylococcus phage Madawaska]|nr:hypothetical protein CPT_Madawaska_133 [Staphylococcus phage Madawaska]